MNRTTAVEVQVYGAEERCASCVNLPSAQETASWLEAALGRKFGDQIRVRYIDIHHPEQEADAVFVKRVIEEDMWYPVVVIDGEVVGEGNPKLKRIQEKLEQLGLSPV
jgi:disulfide oxidoreductase YuzD